MKYDNASNAKQEADETGTPHFLSPEQYSSNVTLTTDIWAFGCILLNIITG